MPQTMKSINTIHRCQTIFRSERLGGEICGAHHLFVFSICNNPGSSQEELAKKLYLNKSTVARALASLENGGYVRREVNPNDKRQTLVYPTEKMTALLPKARAIAKDWNSLISEGISESELAAFHTVLAKMEENARAVIASLEDCEK